MNTNDERFEILRRICDRGRNYFLLAGDSAGVDMFEHMANELNLLCSDITKPTLIYVTMSESKFDKISAEWEGCDCLTDNCINFCWEQYIEQVTLNNIKEQNVLNIDVEQSTPRYLEYTEMTPEELLRASEGWRQWDVPDNYTPELRALVGRLRSVEAIVYDRIRIENK